VFDSIFSHKLCNLLGEINAIKGGGGGGEEGGGRKLPVVAVLIKVVEAHGEGGQVAVSQLLHLFEIPAQSRVW
jgi:hypothetical protein